MKRYNNLLVVCGSGRNVGKTELICRIIAKISSQSDIYGLKVSAAFPDTELLSAHDSNAASEMLLFEENLRDTSKDTSRMLRAGACRVFYLCSCHKDIPAGFESFLNEIPPDVPIISESNSLSSHVRPGLVVLVQSPGDSLKKRVDKGSAEADLIVISDGKSGFPMVESISCRDNEWFLEG